MTSIIGNSDSRLKTQDLGLGSWVWGLGSHRGFTLVELIVILAIIGLIVMTSVPALTGYASQVRLKTSTREVVGLLSLARSAAIGSRSIRTVVVNPDARDLIIEETLQEEEPKRVRLAAGVTVEVQSAGQSSGPLRLAFQPSGGLAGRTVSLILSNGKYTETVTVTATTGAITIK